MQNQYVSVDDAARELEVSRATAWTWIKRRGVQTYKFMGTRRTYIKREDIDTLREPVPIDFTNPKKAAARSNRAAA